MFSCNHLWKALGSPNTKTNIICNMALRQRNSVAILTVFMFQKIHWKVMNISNIIRFLTSQAVLREALVTVQLSRIISIIGGTFPRFSFQPRTILNADWESGQLASTKMMSCTPTRLTVIIRPYFRNMHKAKISRKDCSQVGCF